VELIVFGLITGAVYAIAASGLVVTYSTSGIFNFAHGALGMLCAYIYWDLRFNDSHKFWLIPQDSALQGKWPAPLALAAVLLVIAPLLGAFIYRVIIVGLHGTSEIVKLVIPVSLLLGAIQFAGWIWKTDKSHTLRPWFGPDSTVKIFGQVVQYHQISIVVIAIVLAVGLRVLLFRTRTGVAMRAVVDDRALLELNGGRPDRASLVSWMVGISLSALAGILITPETGGSLSATLLTLLVINAFAAAMIGRLRSLPYTFAGAVLLGFLTRAAFKRPSGFMPKGWDTWVDNLRLAAPMILLFVVLLLLPQDRLRGTVITRTRERFAMPSMRQSVMSAGVFIVVIAMLSALMAPTALITLANGVAAALIILSLVLLVGYAGEVSFATMAFAGIGGTVFYHWLPNHKADVRAGFSQYFVAVLVCAVVGAVVALPALRLRGLYLGLATAAFSVGVEKMVFGELTTSRRIYPVTLVVIASVGVASIYSAYLAWRARGAAIALGVAAAVFALAATNGWLQDEKWSPLFPQGNLTIPRPELFGYDFKSQQRYLMLLTVVFALLGLMLIAIRGSAYGRRLAAMKDSPAACATLGLNIVRLKLSVFMLSAAMAGLGGCLFGGQIGAISAERFGLFESFAMFMLLVVAGVGYVSGGFTAGLLHGVVFVVMQNVLTKLGHDYSAFHSWFKWLASFTAVMPALIGIGLGKNPSGFVNDIFVGFRPLVRKVPQVFYPAVAVEVAAWFLAWQEIIGNWTFALFTIAAFLLAPAIGRAVRPEAFLDADALAARSAATADVPLELVGIDRPFTEKDKRRYDTALGFDARVVNEMVGELA
jgi:branched-chain amino acid transport system permease protein